MSEDFKKAADFFAKRGKLIEAGFVSLLCSCFPNGISEKQKEEIRMYFFAGAKHLFDSIVNFLDEGEEPTEADLERMSLVQFELKEYIQKFELKNLPAKGNG